MKLSKRLQTIYDMVQGPCVVADIGCDHGLLPIALVKNGKCDKAYACDVRKGPLSRAEEAIHSMGLQNQIITKLTDGLHGLEDDVEVVIIAGMGYDTIRNILQDSLEKTKYYKQIIIQCNSRVDDLRRWLHQNGFMIDAEELIKDQHYYQMLSIHYEASDMSEEDYLFGIYLEDHPLFKEYWTHVLHKQKEIIKGMKPYHEGYQVTDKKIKMIEKKLKELA